MSQREGTGRRTAVYSQFHRTDSIDRFIKDRRISLGLSTVDLDHALWCEYGGHNFPLCLIETTSQWDGAKCSEVTTALAREAGRPSFLVRIKEARTLNPMASIPVPDVELFRVQRTYPDPEPEMELTPEEYAHWLRETRDAYFRMLPRTVDPHEVIFRQFGTRDQPPLFPWRRIK